MSKIETHQWLSEILHECSHAHDWLSPTWGDVSEILDAAGVSVPDDDVLDCMGLMVDEIERLRAENKWLRSLVPPQVLASAVKALDEELKQENEVSDAH